LVSLRKTSLVDYPGKVSAVVFLPGCNLRCPWCQNRELVSGGGTGDSPAHTIPEKPGGGRFVSLEDALRHIAGRKTVLGGVVLSGGEPCVHPFLGPLIAEIHQLGLPVKLDTNGMNPPALEALFEAGASRPDYLALDLKLAPERYGELLPAGENAARRSGAPPPEKPEASGGAALRESAALIRSSGIPHEYRSLALPEGRFGPPDIRALCPLVDGSPWYFRAFAPGNCLAPPWDRFDSPPRPAVVALAAEARGLGKNGIALPRTV
jgi:pyruvate formate lyase activating enzyme